MDFGKVAIGQLYHISLSLPDDPIGNAELLKTGRGNTEFHVGLGSRGKKEWLGSLYPIGTKEKDYLHYYGQSFNSIEVGSTFYKVPSEGDIVRWENQVPKDFLFCPKFPQKITHISRLRGGVMDTDQFLAGLEGFSEKLGPIFLMPNPTMGIGELPTIMRFIENIPSKFKLFLELRHPSFFENGLPDQLIFFMREKKRGMVITDSAGRRDAVHMQLTVPEVYVRFNGYQLHESDYSRIDQWVKRIKGWMDQGLEKCYFFIHQDPGLYGPKLVAYLIEQLNEHCGTDLREPILKYQQGLF